MEKVWRHCQGDWLSGKVSRRKGLEGTLLSGEEAQASQRDRESGERSARTAAGRRLNGGQGPPGLSS